MSEPSRFERSALAQLSLTRMLAFLREPEAIFWVFAFPILLALALGIAFRNTGPPRSAVVVSTGLGDGALRRALMESRDLTVSILPPSDAEALLRRGKALVLVRPGDPPTLEYDPSRPETRLAQLLDIYYISVAHRIGFAFHAHSAVLLSFGHAARRHKVVVVDHLGADKTALQVGVDGPGGALGHRAPAYRPGAHLVFASRQEADQAQQRVRFADHFAQPRRPQSHALAKLGGVLR